MRAYNFVLSGRHFTKFLSFNAEGTVLINAVRFCRYLHRFERYFRSNSKVVVNHTDFCTFFALPNFKRSGTPKSCTCVNTSTERHVKRQSSVGLHNWTPVL